MYLKVSIINLILVISALSALAKPMRNLLKNGGFEYGMPLPRIWRLYSPEKDTGEIFVSTQKSFKGAKKFVFKPKAGNKNYLKISQRLLVKQLINKKIRLKLAVKIVKGKGSCQFRIREYSNGKYKKNTILMWLRFDKNDNLTIIKNGNGTVSPDAIVIKDFRNKWHEIEMEGIISKTANAADVYLCVVGDQIEVQLDNVSLSAITIPPMKLSNYKGEYSLDDPISFDTKFKLDKKDLPNYKLMVEIYKINNPKLVYKEEFKINSKDMNIVINDKNIAEGSFKVNVTLLKRQGTLFKKIAMKKFNVSKIKGAFD